MDNISVPDNRNLDKDSNPRRKRSPTEDASSHYIHTTNTKQRHHLDATSNNPEFYLSGNQKNDGGSNNAASDRLRGGGSSEFLDAFLKSDADFMWRNTKFTMPTRLEGGGCGKASNPRNNEDGLHKDQVNPACLVGNRCCRKNSDKLSVKPPYDSSECPPRKPEFGVCMKKPCLGTDCLIKAFKDTQDFVDSIGKVPGLAGLGILESPYFGKSQELKENKKLEVKQLPTYKQPEANYLSVVQEATTTFNDPTQGSKAKKKDEKIEKQKESENIKPPVQINEESPCGEPKCKSRPKRTGEAENTIAEMNNLGDKLSPKNDQKSLKSKYYAGPYGDLKKNSKNNSSQPNKFVYSFGNSYPTSVYGHKNCNYNRRRVPANQGWMWNETDTIANRKIRTGWKPGAISILLRDMMNAAKAGFLNESNRPKSAPSRSKKDQKLMNFNALKKVPVCNEEQTEEETNFPPTLHIHRRDGDYYITMYPIRQETSDVPRVDEPLNPLQFKIVKSKDSLASSSTASDMEIEFSPPAAVNRIKKKPNVVHTETNVTQQEILDEMKAFLNLDSSKLKKKDKNKKNQKKKKYEDCL